MHAYIQTKATLHISANPAYHEKTNCHVVREKIQLGLVPTLHVSSANQLSYLFTKAVDSDVFQSLIINIRCSS
jgi:hypothetical protein